MKRPRWYNSDNFIGFMLGALFLDGFPVSESLGAFLLVWTVFLFGVVFPIVLILRVVL